MSALAFPSSPSLDDIFTSAGRSWRWNGSRWVAIGTLISPSRLSGEGAETGDILVFDGSSWSAVPLTNSQPAPERLWVFDLDGNTTYLGSLLYSDMPSTGSAFDSPLWSIDRTIFDTDGALVSKQSATGAWSNRANLNFQ